MIYTVTFNPSLDYVVQIDNMELGQINRTKKENIYPGGKGNNVSVILSNLGLESRALGFKAGFTGKVMDDMLRAYGCQTDFILLPEGNSRINVKIKADTENLTTSYIPPSKNCCPVGKAVCIKKLMIDWIITVVTAKSFTKSPISA